MLTDTKTDKMSASQEKRLFFGFEVISPWPEKFPPGRILDEKNRHMTLLFLGHVSDQKVIYLLSQIPKPQLLVTPVGRFDRCLFLPTHQPRVVAWHMEWFHSAHMITGYHNRLQVWFREQGFTLDEKKPFLPHVTLCRSPFVQKEWQQQFTPLPYRLGDLHLYESIGNLQYESKWKLPITAAFEEIEHTADIAYRISGENLQQLYQHALVALAFRFPSLLEYQTDKDPFVIVSSKELLNNSESGQSAQVQYESLQQVVKGLNDVITYVDGEIGCPFKAVSYHGELIRDSCGLLKWEMIVDV